MRIALYVLSQILQFILVAAALRLTLFPKPETGPDWAITLAYGSLLIPALLIAFRHHAKQTLQALLWACGAWIIGRLAGNDPIPAILVYFAMAFVFASLKLNAMAICSILVGLYGIYMALTFGDKKPDDWYQAAWNWIWSALVMSAAIPLLRRNDDDDTKIENRQHHEQKAA